MLDRNKEVFQPEIEMTTKLEETEELSQVGNITDEFATAEMTESTVQKETQQMSPMQERMDTEFRKLGRTLVMDWDRLGEHNGAINSIISGVLTRKPMKSTFKRIFTGSGVRSDMAYELAGSLQSVIANYTTKLQDPNDSYDINNFTEELFRLSMATDGYIDTHRGRRSTSEGRYIKENTKEIKKFIVEATKSILSEEDERQIKDNSGVEVEKYDAKKIDKTMKVFAHQYNQFSAELGRGGIVNSPRKRLQMKLDFFSKYEREIKLYRRLHIEIQGDEMDYETGRCIAEYENCLRWKKILDAMPAEKEKEKDEELNKEVDTAIEEQVALEDERAKYEKLEASVIDKGLSAEQLAGIEEIDQWLIRNYNNGGILGAVFGVKNPHFSFMNKLFSMSKRERLHMYYLVQTNKRKAPSAFDVGVSQNGEFVPNLEEFKNRMLATKWKFWKRLSGGYTYMHKLEESYDITREYSSQIKSVVELRDAKPQKVGADAPIAEQKEAMVKKLYRSLTEYQDFLKEGAAEKDKTKQAQMEKVAQEMAAECEDQMKELAKLDGKSEKIKIDNKKIDNKLDIKDGAPVAGGVASFGAQLPKYLLDYTKKWFGWEWGLNEAGFDKMHLWTGSFANSLSVVGGSVSVLLSIWSLKDRAGSISSENLASEITDIVKSTADVIKTGISIGRDAAGEVVKNAATGIGVVKMACTGAKLCAEVNGLCSRSLSEKKSYMLFTKKSLDRIHQKKEGKKFTDKEEREERYKANMLTISSELKSRDKLSCFFTGIEFVGDTIDVFLPGVGKVISCIGMGLKKLFSGSKSSSIKEHLFDAYYNTYVIRSKMMESLYKRYPGEQLKCNNMSLGITDALRKKIAVEAGFSDLNSACEHVAKKYALQLRDKLFGDAPVTGDEKQQIISLLKSLGLKYNAKKQKPDLDILTQKLCAN